VLEVDRSKLEGPREDPKSEGVSSSLGPLEGVSLSGPEYLQSTSESSSILNEEK
jgi:hypothetical protein